MMKKIGKNFYLKYDSIKILIMKCLPKPVHSKEECMHKYLLVSDGNKSLYNINFKSRH